MAIDLFADEPKDLLASEKEVKISMPAACDTAANEKAEAEARAKEFAKKEAEAEVKAKADTEAKIKAEAEAKAKAEADAKAQREEEENALRQKRAAEREALETKRDSIEDDEEEIPITAASVQHTANEKILENLQWIHRKISLY